MNQPRLCRDNICLEFIQNEYPESAVEHDKRCCIFPRETKEIDEIGCTRATPAGFFFFVGLVTLSLSLSADFI